MRLISKSDVEAMQLSNLVIKTNARSKVYSDLEKKWQNNRSNPDIAFLFAACALAYVYEETVAPDRHKYLSKSIEALTDCINLQDDWWMARFLRIGALQSLVVPSDGKNTLSAETDCEILLGQQSKCDQKEPYFLCTYLLEAKSYIFQGNIECAVKSVEKGLEDIEQKELKYPLNILLQPFGDAITIFRSLGMRDLADRIKNAGLKLFPNSSSLASF